MTINKFLAILGGCIVCSTLPNTVQAEEKLSLILASEPWELSGVAALPNGGGYAVVGNTTENLGYKWPSGEDWRVHPKIWDLESVDVASTPGGEVLWLVLGEGDKEHEAPALLAEPENKSARYRLDDDFREICGRGVEGLSLRHNEGKWPAVVLWEGGYFSPGQCESEDDRKYIANKPFDAPKFVIIEWEKGVGFKSIYVKRTKLTVDSAPNGQFRATDVAWYNDELIVLLGSTEVDGGPDFDHTWLQRFDLAGKPVEDPVKLEEKWGDFRREKNWEALDTSPDGKQIIMGYDRDGASVLVVFNNPFLKKP